MTARGAPGAGVTLRVVELLAEQTHDLRRRVLRSGTPSSDVSFPEDGWPGTVHLGALVGDSVVGTSTWITSAWADAPERAAVQLRGMATEPALQGHGIGAVLVQAGLDRAAAAGAELAWANARDSALGFYERTGWTVVGDGFVSMATALPHHAVVIELTHGGGAPPAPTEAPEAPRGGGR